MNDMKVNFMDCDRKTPYLLPPSLEDWLPEGHLAGFVVEIVEQLDLRSLKDSYAGRGSCPYNPVMLTAPLSYGYPTGVFSSRKLERSTYDSVAFRYIAANPHPDHDTIASFRRRFLPELTELFLQILEIAGKMSVLKLGSVSLDGTKVKANASRHKAVSYGHALKLEEQLKTEVTELLQRAEAADQTDIPDGMSIPEELMRREERLKAIAEAKAEIERRAAERYAAEREAYEKKVAERNETGTGDRKKVERFSAETAYSRSHGQRPGEPDRQRIADHVLQEWIRTGLQCADRGGYAFNAECCRSCQSGIPTTSRN